MNEPVQFTPCVTTDTTLICTKKLICTATKGLVALKMKGLKRNFKQNHETHIRLLFFNQPPERYEEKSIILLILSVTRTGSFKFWRGTTAKVP